MNWIRLSGPRCINLDRVNMIDFEPINDVCTITWATGDAPLELKGPDAIAFMTALDEHHMPFAHGFWFEDFDDGDKGTGDDIDQMQSVADSGH